MLVFKLFFFLLSFFLFLFLFFFFFLNWWVLGEQRGFRTKGTHGGWASFQEPAPGASVPGYLERHLLGQSGQ